MRQPGQVVLFRFPRTDHGPAKLRPAVQLARIPGAYDDWLVCMVSTRLAQAVQGFDEIVQESDPDFEASGLTQASVIRCGRLAVVDGATLLGSVGEISAERMERIKLHLRAWLS